VEKIILNEEILRLGPVALLRVDGPDSLKVVLPERPKENLSWARNGPDFMIFWGQSQEQKSLKWLNVLPADRSLHVLEDMQIRWGWGLAEGLSLGAITRDYPRLRLAGGIEHTAILDASLEDSTGTLAHAGQGPATQPISVSELPRLAEQQLSQAVAGMPNLNGGQGSPLPQAVPPTNRIVLSARA
jgi:hypothetical protein